MLKYFFLFLSTTIQISAIGQDLIIKNINILTYENNFKPYLGHIEIDKGKITKVKEGHPKNEKAIKVIDGKNKYLIPGFIDSHNHINVVPGLSSEQEKKYPELVKNYRKQLPHSYLYHGFTTIVDLFTTDEDIIKSFKSNKQHPDLYTCGGAAAEYQGYPMIYFPESEKLKNVPNFINSHNRDEEEKHSPKNAIKGIIERNGIVVKTHYESGFSPNKKLPVPSEKNLKLLIKEAHKNNLPVLIHANSLESFQMAINVGADGFAHGLWKWQTKSENDKIPLAVKIVLDQVILNKMAYQPTTQVMKGLVSLFDSNYLNDPLLEKVISKNLIQFYKSNDGKWFEKEITSESNKSDMENVYNNGIQSLSYINKNNGFLIFGSDTPSAPIYSNPPGLNGYYEIQNWIKAGVSHKRLLEALTINNAKFLKLQNKIGSIQEGKIANLVLLNKNPLEEIEAYNDIDSIILHGEIHKREIFEMNKNDS